MTWPSDAVRAASDFSIAGFNLKRIVVVAVPQVVPEISDVPPQHPHPLRLLPVALLMPDEWRFVDALGQDKHAQRRQRDASVPEGAEEPADDVGSGAGGHGSARRLVAPAQNHSR